MRLLLERVLHRPTSRASLPAGTTSACRPTPPPPPPPTAADRPLWSVLVGCVSIQEPFHNLRLHRFRVAASGRITGHTDETL
jgi:hypothetical protein